MVDALDWPILIAHLMAARSSVYEVERGRLWDYALPRVGAKPEQIDAAEARLGRRLDPQYRELLGFANGWPSIFRDDCLFGTEELGQGDLWTHAAASFRYIAEASPELARVTDPEAVLPIGCSETSPSITLQGDDAGSHVVRWFYAGSLGEQWPDFAGFLAALIEFNRRDVVAFATDGPLRDALAGLPEVNRARPDPQG